MTEEPIVSAATARPADAIGESSHELSRPQALELIRRLLGTKRLDEAEQLCSAILQHWPGDADALHLGGVIRHLQQRYDEALPLIAHAVERMPDRPGPYNSLGNVLARLDRIDEAMQAYQRAVDLAGETADAVEAHDNLGRMHRKRGDLAEAERECRHALTLKPDAATAWYNLSLILIRQGRVKEGVYANGKAIALWPRNEQPRENVIRALVLLGERDEAARLYRDWLAEEPDNEVVKHHLAGCIGQGAPERASDAYVEIVFDRFAHTFDGKLQSLQYRAPELVAAALRGVADAPMASLDIGDAGCGTGLCGPLLRPWARSLTGVDLSGGMLQKAEARGVYDALHKAELVAFLNAHPSAYDVVVSADTLCYFGDLRAATSAAAAALRPGGWLIYTVEALVADAGEPYRIAPSGRYAHARRHVETTLALAGFAVHRIDAVELRMEAGSAVEGWLAVGQRVA